MDILHLIDRLDSLIENGFGVPGTGKVMVDREATLNLIDEMRASVPEDLQHAQEVLNAREALLTEAKEAAERTRREADAHARQLLDQHELTTAARLEAQQIIGMARQDADTQMTRLQAEIAGRRRELDEYSLTLLRRLEGNLNAQLGQVKQGIEGLLEKQRRPGMGVEEDER